MQELETAAATGEKDRKRRTVILVVTHRCNLSCSYCYQNNKSDKRMTLEQAKHIFARMFEESAAFGEIEFDFLGGEPLLEFELIRDLCEWAWNQSWSKPYLFFTTTNGTVMTGEMKEWFSKNKEGFYISLSFDGLAEAQRMNRSNSDDLVDLDFFAANWPDQPIKMTVSPDSLPLLADGIIFLHKKGFKIGANLALGIHWDLALIGEFNRQLDRLMDFYLANPEYSPATILDMKLYGVLDEEAGPKKFCGTHDHMVTIDTDGEAYPCHTFTPLVLSPEQISELRGLDLDDLDIYHSEKCDKCAVQRVCPTCYGLNFKFRGKLSGRDTENYCSFVKAQVLANCKFQARRLQAVATSETGEISHEDFLTAKSILKIASLTNP